MRLPLAAGALLGLLLAAPVAAAAQPADVHVVPGQASVISSPRGRAISFTGGGFLPDNQVTLSIDGLPRGAVTSSSVGTITVQLPIPPGRTALVAASGPEPGGRMRVVTAEVRIPRMPAPSAPLAQSIGGAPARVYSDLLAGLAFVLLCVVFVLGGHLLRRSRSSTA